MWTPLCFCNNKGKEDTQFPSQEMPTSLSIEREDDRSEECEAAEEENESEEIEEDDECCEEEEDIEGDDDDDDDDDEEWQDEGDSGDEDAGEVGESTVNNAESKHTEVIVDDPPRDADIEHKASQGREEPNVGSTPSFQPLAAPLPAVGNSAKDAVPAQQLTGSVWTRYFGGNRLRIPERRQRAEDEEVKALLLRFARRRRT